MTFFNNIKLLIHCHSSRAPSLVKEPASVNSLDKPSMCYLRSIKKQIILAANWRTQSII